MERAFQPEACDFSGWATRNDLKCSDGRVIRRDAFKHDDGIKVPLVWNHQHNDPRNVLGHAWLENRPEGVYTYGFFNDSESGEIGKILVKHGDICALSIYANQLQQRGCDVLHGEIREVSLVHAGANPGAFIDSMLKHGEDSDDEAIIYTGMPLYLSHSDADKQEDKADDVEKKDEPEKKTDSDEEKTVADVINSMTEEQKNVMYAMIGQAMDDQGESAPESEDNNDDDSKGGTNTMKHNVFDKDDRQKENVLVHSDGSEVSSEEISTIFGDIKRYGSLKDNLPGLIQAAIDVLMAFFAGIVDALKGIDTATLLQGIVGIGLLAAIMAALSAVAALVPGAMVGVLGMGLVIAELALVLAAVGALAQIPGLQWLINEGGNLLQGIGTAIGKFIGGIVGGFMSGVSSQFPQIATDLSGFMTNIQPFIQGASAIDPSMMDGVKALAETILILTAANILEGLTSWFTAVATRPRIFTILALIIKCYLLFIIRLVNFADLKIFHPFGGRFENHVNDEDFHTVFQR